MTGLDVLAPQKDCGFFLPCYKRFCLRRLILDLTFLLFYKLQDCFGRPIASAPDAWFDVVERYSNDNNKTLK